MSARAKSQAGTTVLGRPVVRQQAQWSTAIDGPPPALAGFVGSEFSPLLAAAADRCLAACYPDRPVPAGERIALVLVSGSGDRVSAAQVRHSIAGSRRIGPLYFFQSVPNSVAGWIAAHWGLGGPVLCLCPVADPLADGLAEAALLISDGDADQVLLLLVEQAGAVDDLAHSGTDQAHAWLVVAGDAE
ncbi:MAG TPA: beta-ketoacyl synthase chain length factor [Jatrophihabitans sp.]|jgi:3-oxoacyl-(acyl-carrier-protein) synthase|nr:beta-ketoacyl synthase chain length factor [Jatrophihabitans sp.]